MIIEHNCIDPLCAPSFLSSLRLCCSILRRFSWSLSRRGSTGAACWSLFIRLTLSLGRLGLFRLRGSSFALRRLVLLGRLLVLVLLGLKIFDHLPAWQACFKYSMNMHEWFDQGSKEYSAYITSPDTLAYMQTRACSSHPREETWHTSDSETMGYKDYMVLYSLWKASWNIYGIVHALRYAKLVYGACIKGSIASQCPFHSQPSPTAWVWMGSMGSCWQSRMRTPDHVYFRRGVQCLSNALSGGFWKDL